MMIATVHDALPIYGDAALAALAGVLLLAAAWWTARARAPREKLPVLGRIAITSALVVASLPAWAFAGLALLFALATADCAPDAYECPL
jgi:uncharacterized membrane protein